MHDDDPGKDLDFKAMPLFKNKRFMIIAGSILLLAVAGGFLSIIVTGDRATDGSAATEAGDDETALNDFAAAEEAEVLPQQRREDEEEDRDGDDQAWTMFDPSIDPFTDPMRLTGTATGGRSGTMAIIESSGTSYIVAENDYVDDLWAVREVWADRVILRAHDKEVTLYLDQPPVTRSLDPDDGDDQGEDE